MNTGNIFPFSKISLVRAETDKIIIPEISKIEGKILEIGCSTSSYRNLFKGMYFGMDLSPIEFPKLDEKSKFVVGNGYKVPFKGKSLDFVFCLAVLEHVEFPESVIKECHRVLKKKGKLLISAVCPLGMRYESNPKYRSFYYQEFKEILVGNGFDVLKHQKVGGPFVHLLSLLESRYKKMFVKEKVSESKSTLKKWDPKIKEISNKKLLRMRGILIDIISSFELSSGLVNFSTIGFLVFAEKM